MSDIVHKLQFLYHDTPHQPDANQQFNVNAIQYPVLMFLYILSRFQFVRYIIKVWYIHFKTLFSFNFSIFVQTTIVFQAAAGLLHVPHLHPHLSHCHDVLDILLDKTRGEHIILDKLKNISKKIIIITKIKLEYIQSKGKWYILPRPYRPAWP